MTYLVLGFVAIGLTGLIALWMGRGARTAPMVRQVVAAKALPDVVRLFAALEDATKDVLVVQQGRQPEPFLQLARTLTESGTSLRLNLPVARWSKPLLVGVEQAARSQGASIRSWQTESDGASASAPVTTYREIDFGSDADAAAEACGEIAREVYRWPADARLTCLVVSSRDAAG